MTFPDFKLSGNILSASNEVKSLDHLLTDLLSDDEDIYLSGVYYTHKLMYYLRNVDIVLMQ